MKGIIQTNIFIIIKKKRKPNWRITRGKRERARERATLTSVG